MAKRKQTEAIVEDPLSRAWKVCCSRLSHMSHHATTHQQPRIHKT